MAVSFDAIQIGEAWTRHKLAALWGYASFEALCRGVVTPKDDNKIVLFVTRRKRPSDAQYRDDLVGSVLLWEGEEKHGSDDRIIAHHANGDEIHVFFRDEQVEPFTYVGQMTLYCAQRLADRPSRFVFQAAVAQAAAA